MNVNVSMRKIVIVFVLLAIACGGLWWYLDSAPKRKAKVEIEAMIKFAQRQALEIAIIEQSVKLSGYKQQIAKAQQAKAVIDPNTE